MSAVLDTDKQATFLKFRERVSDLLPSLKNDFHRSDDIIKKFLIVCRHNVEQAEVMFRKAVAWRKANNVDTILERPVCHELDPFYKLLQPGFDKQGHPFFIGQVGRWDPNGLLHPMVKTEAGKIMIGFLEKGINSCEKISKDGKMITKGFALLDCAEFDYTWLTYTEVVSTGLRLLAENLQVALNNYPDVVYKIVVINAPSVFPIVWTVVKPLLSPELLANIIIYGAYGLSTDGWKDYLLEHIDPDVLPSKYGGANTCGLLNCQVEVDREDPTPKIELEVLPAGDLIEHYVGPGKIFTVDITTAPGDIIVWNFKTEACDIDFKVECDDGRGVIIEKCRVDSHKLMQKGRLECPSKAKYTLSWDNYYSYMTGKKLFYAVRKRKGQTSEEVTPA